MFAGITFLHPNQFRVNEAWIIFKLNDVPLRTAQDGSFDCVCLMDAASCFILANAFVAMNESEPSQIEVRQLFEAAWAHKQEFPIKLFVPVGQFQTHAAKEAEAQGIEVVRVPEGQLMPFIREAKESFKEYTKQGGMAQFPKGGTFDPGLN